MSGKTTLARRLAKKASESGRIVLVLDPLLDPAWKESGADYITDNSDSFLKTCKDNKNCTLFIDEAGESCGQHDKKMYWLATQSRHWGHQANFIAQRANMVARNIRDNCSKLFAFKVSFEDSKLLENDFCYKELRDVTEYVSGECLYVTRFGVPQKINVFENNA
jgi:hypothetical protein